MYENELIKMYENEIPFDELAEIMEELDAKEDFSKPEEMVLEEEKIEKIELLKFLSNENHYSYFFDEPQEEKIENGILPSTPISQIQSGNSYLIRGIINGFFKSLLMQTICIQCFKNTDDCSCQDNGSKKGILIFHLELEDETGKIDCLILDSVAEKLVQTKIELIKQNIDNPDFLDNVYCELIGKDVYVKGKVEFWKNLNRLIMLIKGFREVDVDEELNAAIKKIDI